MISVTIASLNIACRPQAIRSYLIFLCLTKKESKDIQPMKTTELFFPEIDTEIEFTF